MKLRKQRVCRAYYAFINAYELEYNFWGMQKLNQLSNICKRGLYSNTVYNDLNDKEKEVYSRLESKLTWILNTGTML